MSDFSINITQDELNKVLMGSKKEVQKGNDIKQKIKDNLEKKINQNKGLFQEADDFKLIRQEEIDSLFKKTI